MMNRLNMKVYLTSYDQGTFIECIKYGKHGSMQEQTSLVLCLLYIFDVPLHVYVINCFICETDK